MNKGKTKVVGVRSWFWAGMFVLMLCLSLVCSNAGATLSQITTYSGPFPVSGSDFGSVIVISSGSDAYGVFGDGDDVVITGDIGTSGRIEATAGAEHAYAVYTDDGSITTDALNGIITATAVDWKAIGLYTKTDSLTTGAIGGTIAAATQDDGAYGLRNDYSDGAITINGDISGMVNATANLTNAAGLYSSGSINITGVISGAITATSLTNENAYGLYASGDITTHDITGTITAKALDEENGYDAYGLYAGNNLTINGNIGSDANITAQVGYSDAYGLYSGNNLSVGAINGVVNATAGHSGAYGLRSVGNLDVGDINGAVNATAGHNGAYGLYSGNGSITTGAIRGTITADAGYHGAYGIYASGDLTINGTVDDGAISNSAVISATAGDDYSGAHALYSGAGDIIINGDVNGTITATAGANAYGLQANDGAININGSINGTITATTTVGSYAYGLYASGDLTVDGNISSTADINATAEDSYAYGLRGGSSDSVTIGDIDGTITATATTGSYAYGLYSSGELTVGNIGNDAVITATAGTNNAYGLFGGGPSTIITGDINGTITATATGSYAYGLYSSGDITVESISRDANISATAGDSDAYGLDSGGTLTINGAIDGKISATATTGYDAYGLYAGNNLTINGNIGNDANISATAGNNGAYGLYSDGDMSVGDINGAVHATAGHNGAFGLYSNSGSITTGVIRGTITADAGHHGAYGIDASGDLTINGTVDDGAISNSAVIRATASDDYSGAHALYSDEGDIIINGDVNGTITATAGANAYGLQANNGSININGSINGTITATTTTGDNAYGLAAGDGDITITGDIGSDAHITAIAAGDEAYGMYASGSITTGAINGTISATASGAEPGSAYGLYADDSITTGAINGTISAEMTDGSGAYGLYSGGNMIIDSIGSTADIKATAAYDEAYGLYSDSDGNITTGAINGKITATAGDDEAYGFYVNSGAGVLTIASIGSNAEIKATAGDSYAYGLASDGSIDIGEIYGTITAEATEGSYAYGMYAHGDITIDYLGYGNSITATAGANSAYGLRSDVNVNISEIDYGGITATATDNGAYGIYAGQDLTLGELYQTQITATAGDNGAYGLRADDGSLHIGDMYYSTISATATDGSGAYGMRSDSNMSVDYMYDSSVTATAGDYGAYGLRSDGDIHIGEMDYSTISATAGDSGAYGLRSDGNIHIGEMDYSTISATAGTSEAAGNNAYGMYAVTGNITVDDMYNSYIYASAYGDNAVGIYSHAGSVNIGMYGGEIHADADGDYAYGILSYGAMNVLIDGGTIIGEAGGTNVAAIQSGRIGAGLETQDANDMVEIVAGSTIIGDINLGMNGTDRDLLLLSGDSWNSTVLDYNVYNVEDINITGGTWHVNGSIINNANGTRVYDEGILMGTGTLGNLYIQDGGTLNPGNSIGTINVANLTIDSGGTYEVEVNDSGMADKVIVTGAANLDGTIRGVALERIRHSFSATVIDAGTLNGEFATVAGNKLFLEFSVDYGEDANVTLNVDPLSYATYARTKNERSIGDAFDDLVANGGDTGDMDDVISAIEDLPTGAAANAAYDQMMPQDALGLPEVTRNMMNQFSGSVLDHMGAVRGSKQYAMIDGSRYLLASADNSLTAPPKTDEWMPFVKGVGTWGNRDGKDDVVGYNYNTYGLMAGMDKLVSEDTLLGFSIGGSRAKVDYDQRGTSADIDSALASLYGSYFKDDWHVDLTLGYSHNWYDSRRGIHFDSIDREAKSDHQGNAYSAAIEFGNNFGGTSMLLEPVAGIGYTLVQQDGYKEKGADSLNLKVDSETMEGFYSRLGLRLAKEFRSEKNPDVVWVPKANVFWIHDFADGVKFDNEFIGGGSFTTQTQDPVRDAFNIGAGLNIYFTKSVRLFVDYGWQTAGSFNANTLQAGAQWSF